MTDSARVILIRDGRLILIQRVRTDQTYYVFPGGRMEPGESPEQTAIREVREEVGLDVALERKVAEVYLSNIGSLQHYFLGYVLGGNFGMGDGPEMLGLYPPQRGLYRPIEMDLTRVLQEDVRSRRVCQLVVDCWQTGWPQTVQYYVETLTNAPLPYRKGR
jgi:8-oxo-dGTP pyrophosphatase MutT (NUDIX family)